MTLSKSTKALPAYQAAHEAAIMVDRSNLGMLKITGDTRLDLLNRMSTQAVNNLGTGEGAATILTTDIGRIIDRLIIYVSSDAVYALTSENNAEPIARYLMRFVFFQDDFHLQDVSADTAIFGVYGAKAGEMLSEAGFDEVKLPLHHWRQQQVAGITTYLHRTDAVAGDGYFAMTKMADKETLSQRLMVAGCVPATESDFEILRIESGLKRFGHELSSDYIPLEADLWDDVSFDKGCYIGQEIIARMESRGRLAKRLVKLHPARPVEPGAVIMAEDKKAGTVTSAAVGPNGPVALGFVKTSVLDKQSTLTIGDTAVTSVEQPTGVREL
jgi:folate-binding protein YgfZ